MDLSVSLPISVSVHSSFCATEIVAAQPSNFCSFPISHGRFAAGKLYLSNHGRLTASVRCSALICKRRTARRIRKKSVKELWEDGDGDCDDYYFYGNISGGGNSNFGGSWSYWSFYPFSEGFYGSAWYYKFLAIAYHVACFASLCHCVLFVFGY